MIGERSLRTRPRGGDRPRVAYRENNVASPASAVRYREAPPVRRALERSATRRRTPQPSIALLYDATGRGRGERAPRGAAAVRAAPFTRGLILASQGDTPIGALFPRVLRIEPRRCRRPDSSLSLIAAVKREAIRILDEAAKAEPFNATAAYGLATALTRAGRVEDSRQAMTRFQALRDNPASVTYASSYLGQGRYAEALASTGLEPDLIDPATPAVGFVDATAAMTGSGELGDASALRRSPGRPYRRWRGRTPALERIASSRATRDTRRIDGMGSSMILVAGPMVIVRRISRQLDASAAESPRRGTTPIAPWPATTTTAAPICRARPPGDVCTQEGDGTFRVKQGRAAPWRIVADAAFDDVTTTAISIVSWWPRRGRATKRRRRGAVSRDFAQSRTRCFATLATAIVERRLEARLAGAVGYTVAIVKNDRQPPRH